MRSFFQLVLAALPLAGRVACSIPASETQKDESNPLYVNAQEAFRDLLNALPEESLHAALNSLTHFREGVFESDRHGVERVHNENPPLATKLIVAAVKDLKKRQTPSNGTTSSPPASSPAPSESSSQGPAVVVPVPVTQTNGNGETEVITSSELAEPTASVPVEVTRTNAQGQTEISTETKPAIVVSTTDSRGSATVITSAVDFAPTAGQVLTTTDGQGHTFITTYTPDGGSVRSLKLITTTGPDGKPLVVTSYTYVNPAAATGTGGDNNPTGTGEKPGLQSGAANKNRAMEAAMVGGAIGGAFALWV
jgi:hypothetical protein